MTGVPLESLPQRIFLDSSTLQMLHKYGAQVWDNESFQNDDRIHGVTDGPATIEALRRIFFVNQRALWQFAISENSLREVAAKGDGRYLQWVYDVLDHWRICLEESGPLSSKGQAIGAKLKTTSFDYLSKGDRRLLFDAVTLECDAFLTCDLRLAKNSRHILAELGIMAVTPIQYWQILEPWANLYV